MSNQKPQSKTLFIGILLIISLLCCKSSAEKTPILHVIEAKWYSGLFGGQIIKTYLVIPEENNNIFKTKKPYGYNFKVNKIVDDTLVSIIIINNFKILGSPSLNKLDIHLDTVKFSPRSADAGVVYSFFIDTSELARKVVIDSAKQIIEFTEFDSLKFRIFKKELFHPNGRLKAQWQEKYDDRYNFVKHGRLDEWYINGNTLKRADFDKGLLNGKLIKYYQDGQIQLEGTYTNSLKDGLWKYYDQKGNISYSGEFLNGTGNLYYSNGEKKTEQKFTQGRKEGIWKAWHENGQIHALFIIENGAYVDSIKIWYPNGQLKHLRILDEDKKIKAINSWFPDGRKVNDNTYSYIDHVFVEKLEVNNIISSINIHDSLETKYYPNKQLKSKAIFDDDGSLLQIKEWHENGQLFKEINYKNGLLNGKWESWDMYSFKRREYFYSNGLPTGTWSSWSGERKLIQAKEYIHEDTCKVTTYNLFNEYLMQQGRLVNGEKDGIWFEYDNSGVLIKKVEYNNGKYVSTVNVKQ